MKASHAHERGTTLLEVTVGMGIFMILASLTVGAFYQSWERYFSIRQRTTADVSLIDALQRINQAVGSATVLPASQIVEGVTYTADSDTLIAHIPAFVADGTVVVGAYDTIIYDLQSEGLVEITEPHGASSRSAHHQLVLGDDVSVVVFVTQPVGGNLAHPLLTTTLGMTTDLLRTTDVISQSSRLALRNM